MNRDLTETVCLYWLLSLRVSAEQTMYTYDASGNTAAPSVAGASAVIEHHLFQRDGVLSVSVAAHAIRGLK